MIVRLYCNGLTRVEGHTQVDLAAGGPFGQHLLRLLLGNDIAAANFRPGQWYDVAAVPSVARPTPVAPPPAAAVPLTAAPSPPESAEPATAGAELPQGALPTDGTA